MVAHYIATRPILDLYNDMVQSSRAWVARRWWEQEGLDLAGARAAAAEDVEGASEVEED